MYILSFFQNNWYKSRFGIKVEEEQFIQCPLTESLYSPFSGDFPLQFCCVLCHEKLRNNFLLQEFGNFWYLMKSFTSWIFYVYRLVQYYTIRTVTIVTQTPYIVSFYTVLLWPPENNLKNRNPNYSDFFIPKSSKIVALCQICKIYICAWELLFSLSCIIMSMDLFLAWCLYPDGVKSTPKITIYQHIICYWWPHNTVTKI